MYSVESSGIVILYPGAMLTGPNNTAFVLSAVITLELRVFGVANEPYMLSAPVLITTVLL
jgi:hypothetical protein